MMDDTREKHLQSKLDWLKSEFENGDKSALLDAVDWCAAWRLVMPDWVANNFMHQHRRWQQFKVKTLDEAFDVQKPKGFHLNKHKQEVDKTFDVYLAILEAERRGLPISNDGAISEVCQKFGINEQMAWDMYRETRKTKWGQDIEKMRKKHE
ncbi:MAG: hypothetical protein KGZ88_18980 [Methylomicrobium sp.]|nr:hypothetical protein [Methylomicrobium sp.]